MKKVLIIIISLFVLGCAAAQSEKRWEDLTEFSGTVANDDVVGIYDLSAHRLKKMDWSDFKVALGNLGNTVLTTGSVTSTHILDGTLANADYGSGSISLDKFQASLKNILLQKNVSASSITALYQFSSGGYGMIFGSDNAFVVPTLSSTSAYSTYVPGMIFKVSDGTGFLPVFAYKTGDYSTAMDTIISPRYLRLNGYIANGSSPALGANTVGSLQVINKSLFNLDIADNAGIEVSKLAAGSASAILQSNDSDTPEWVTFDGLIEVGANGFTNLSSSASKFQITKISSQIVYSPGWDSDVNTISKYYIKKINGIPGHETVKDTFDFMIPLPVVALGSQSVLDSVLIEASGYESSLDSAQIVKVSFGTETKADQADVSQDLENNNQETVNYNFGFTFNLGETYYLRLFLDVYQAYIYNLRFYYHLTTFGSSTEPIGE